MVRATAGDVLSGLQRVDFYIDGVFRWADASAPYEFNWNTESVGDGTHAVMAVAYDYASNSGSHSIMVGVDNTPPTVIVTSPSNGATVSGYVLVSASASDAMSGVQRVEFYVDGSCKSVDTSAPYEYNWNTEGVGGGPHTLRAVAYDYVSNSGSHSISVIVDNTVIPEFSSSAVVMAVVSTMLLVIMFRQRARKEGRKRE